ncbi:MAG TPA: pyrroline-5-carboxylate reductase [Actinomycetota bacterium]|nr:pyrroline-5-carboxylate reductase [Actinomycetota bacterium]
MGTPSEAVAVIGCGKMGELLAAGMVRSGVRRPDQILVTDADSVRVSEAVARHGFVAPGGNPAAVGQAGTVILAVKPKDVDAVLSEISPVAGGRLVVSIAAGISTAFLEDGLGDAGIVVRAMPNVASQVGEGITAICAGMRAGAEHLEVARKLLESVGPVIVVAETYLDAVTAVSGSGPAYFALFAEAMIDAGVTVGLSRDVAAQLVAQTMRGTAALLTDGRMTPVQVREAVTSPGGTTAMAVRELERAGVRAAVHDAVQAALDQATKLGAGPPGRSRDA